MSNRIHKGESGFALILALLALLLLTTLGLALSSSTSVELQISTNQRWAESARYNAEAGLEYGKSLLVAVPDWSGLLPPARTSNDWDEDPGTSSPTWSGTAPNVSPIYTRATRNFESYRCDRRGYGMGYGVVLDDGSTAGPQEYVSSVGGATLNGAFTLWIRRPVMWSAGNGAGTTLQDYPSDDVIMLVSEGVAPYSGSTNTSTFAAMNRSVYMVEALLTRKGAPVLDQSQCNTRQGQAGSSSSGGNTSGCVALTGGTELVRSLSGGTDVGTGVLK